MTCLQKCRVATAIAHLKKQSKWRAVLWKCGNLLKDSGDQKNLVKNLSDRDRDGKLCYCQVSPGSTQMHPYCKLIDKAGIIHQIIFYGFEWKLVVRLSDSHSYTLVRLEHIFICICSILSNSFLYVQFYQTVFLSSPFLMTAFGLVWFTKFAEYLMFVTAGSTCYKCVNL